MQDGILPEFRPSVIIPVGEVLTEQMRKLMQSVFQAKVADIYGCNEAGDVAWQCLEGGHYHINIDNVIVEVLTDGKPAVPGQIGEVVITNLNRYAMPIIRYKNGDLARLSTQDCPCGCKLPMIAEIIGRSGEDITLPTGRIVPWNELKSLMNHPQIRQFQIIQNTKGDLLIKYIKEPNADKLALDELLKSRYRRLLNNTLPIETDCVNKISSPKWKKQAGHIVLRASNLNLNLLPHRLIANRCLGKLCSLGNCQSPFFWNSCGWRLAFGQVTCGLRGFLFVLCSAQGCLSLFKTVPCNHSHKITRH